MTLTGEAGRLYSREWRKKNPEKRRAIQRRYYEGHREGVRKQILRRHGLTEADFSRMLAEQGGVCAICGSSNTGVKNRNWHVDHCHATGVVRQLLCAHCNRLLGAAKDDPVILKSAISYLRRHGRPSV